LIFRRAVFDHDVLALDEACFLQALAERGHQVSGIGELAAEFPELGPALLALVQKQKLRPVNRFRHQLSPIGPRPHRDR
jgi:hypothetical protein